MQPQRRAGLKVSVVVVTFESEGVIERCLAAVTSAVREHPSEILLVDNASRDATVRRARAACPGARIVELERNLGFAAANNRAFELASGCYLALVNSDAFPDPGAIDRLIACAEQNPRAGLVAGSLRDGRGRPQPCSGAFPSLSGELGVALFFHRVPGLSRLRLSVTSANRHRTATRVDWVSGAFCLARPEVGPIPDAAFMYGEDVEWSLQASELGYERWIEPTAGAVHLGGASSSSEQAAQLRQAGRVAFAMRWFGRRGTPALGAIRAILLLHGAIRIAIFAMLLPLRPDRGRRGIAEFRHLTAEAWRWRRPA